MIVKDRGEFMMRQPMPHQDPKERIKNFNEVALGYSTEQAVAEAKRCIQCKKPLCIGGCPVEIDIPALKQISKTVRRGVRNHVDEYVLRNNGRIYLLAEGRLINLAAAEGHPASVMDMSFSTQALKAEYVV